MKDEVLKRVRRCWPVRACNNKLLGVAPSICCLVAAISFSRPSEEKGERPVWWSSNSTVVPRVVAFLAAAATTKKKINKKTVQ